MFDFSYEKISSLFPQLIVDTVSRLMSQGGFERITARAYIGFSLFFSISLALIAFFLVQFITSDKIISTIIPIVVFSLCETLFYILLVSTADARASQIEKVLPHALLIISSNIKAGMTLENAIWGAARPEFGPLQNEINKVSADVFSGDSIEVALSRLTTRVRSPIVERAVKLLVQGIALGGGIANLLEEVSRDIRTVQQLKNEIVTSTTTYAIFIVFAALIASPLLFSISVFYADLNQNVFQQKAGSVEIDEEAVQRAGLGGLPTIGLGSGSAKNAIKVEDIRLFAIASIVITSLCAAIILGLIQSGNAISGVFYIPIFIIVSSSIFFLASFGLNSVLSPVFS